MSLKNYLVIPRVFVKNANALSSPITIGVPAVSAFLGMAHKIQRLLNADGFPSIRISGVGIIIHKTNLRVFKSRIASKDFLFASSNPLKKDGGRPSSIPDPKIDFSASLVLEVEDKDFSYLFDTEELILATENILKNGLRIAGGDILPPLEQGKPSYSFKGQYKLRYETIDNDDSVENKKFLRSLMPGYALIERRDLLVSEMENGKDPCKSLFDYLAIHNVCSKDENGVVEWKSERKIDGWLVPISVGFQGITQPQKAKNQRDDNYDHLFAENLITLGEYKIVSNFGTIDELIWRYEYDSNNYLFKCVCNNGGF